MPYRNGGFNEFKTAAYLQQRLEKAGINIKKYTETGFTADIVGSEDGPAIGLRGDIDALPYKNEAGGKLIMFMLADTTAMLPWCCGRLCY